jgi:hypothetical protein
VHPAQFRTTHIVRRISKSDVRLLANLLPTVKPGALLAAERGEGDWPHNVYRFYWPLASAQTFEAAVQPA